MPQPILGQPRILADRFEILEVLGRGGMGTVYAARDILLDRIVAVKILDEGHDTERIEREARAAARIHDPRIVTILDLRRMDDGTPFLVMEALPGRTLADDLRDGPLRPARFDRLVDDLVGGLAAAHAAGVCHRDIKPSNILLDGDGFRITDFGLASLDEDPGAPENMGTLVYVAPERFAGAAPTTQADVFAAGVVLREALDGVHPFRGDTTAETVDRIRSGQATPIDPSADARVAAVLDRAISLKPRRRPADAGELLARLRPSSKRPTSAASAPTTIIDLDAPFPAGRVDDDRTDVGATENRAGIEPGSSNLAADPDERDHTGPLRGMTEVLPAPPRRARASAAAIPALSNVATSAAATVGEVTRRGAERVQPAVTEARTFASSWWVLRPRWMVPAAIASALLVLVLIAADVAGDQTPATTARMDTPVTDVVADTQPAESTPVDATPTDPAPAKSKGKGKAKAN